MKKPEDINADWPVFGLNDDIRPTLERSLQASQGVVMATLYNAVGGSPRGIGAQMVIAPSAVSGYLSGGCVEADVTRHAWDVLETGRPRWLIYGKGGPIDIQLPCGGKIELLLERIDPTSCAARALLTATHQRHAGVWVSDGTRQQFVADETFHLTGKAGLADQAPTIYRRFKPRTRFVVIGSDPTALALAMMAQQIGMEVHFIRPKGPEVPPPVPGVTYWRQSPEAALTEIGLDPWSAVAVATHQEEDDHEALVSALGSSVGYVGLLGSVRKLPRIKARLASSGLSLDQVAKLKAPIGLPIGGKSPWEIATSVVAEICQIMNAAQTSSIRAVEAA